MSKEIVILPMIFSEIMESGQRALSNHRATPKERYEREKEPIHGKKFIER